MGKLLQFHQHEGPDASREFPLSDLLATVGAELLDKKGSFRCEACKTIWKGFNEKAEFDFDSLGCPNRCNLE